jgi:hypothetical protein
MTNSSLASSGFVPSIVGVGVEDDSSPAVGSLAVSAGAVAAAAAAAAAAADKTGSAPAAGGASTEVTAAAAAALLGAQGTMLEAWPEAEEPFKKQQHTHSSNTCTR